MPVTIKVNGTANSLVHKGSNGISMATIPDVCKTPSPGGPVPLPYPNISQSVTLDKGTTTVKADGGMMIAIKGSEFSMSNGDNPGVAGGVKSSTFMKESTWILYSFDVKMDGGNACRLTDKKFQNHENTVDLAGTFQLPCPASERPIANRLCKEFCKDLDKNFKKTKSGKWVKRKSAPKRGKWSQMLEKRLEKAQGGPPWKAWGVTFRHSDLPAPRPDALRGNARGNCQAYDFKFPGDYARAGKKKGAWGQFARLKKLCKGRKPIYITPENCKC